MGEIPPWLVTTLQSLVVIGIVTVELLCFLEVEEQDSILPRLNRCYCLSLKHVTYHSHTLKLSGRRHNNLLVPPMKGI